MNKLPKVSVIIPTRNRPKDLKDLLLTIYNQDYPPIEVIIVDDSSTDLTEKVVISFSSQFKSIGCKLKYIKGNGEGLPAARNIGIKFSEGDIILFLDDDTLLDQNVINALATFFKDNPKAMGVQPNLLSLVNNIESNMTRKLKNAIYKVLMLSYYKENELKVRRSGMGIFPINLKKVISTQRLFGCCCCYKREVFNKLTFDTNLKRWAYMEDLDFSYRLYHENPNSLYAIPYAKVIHKVSKEAKLPIKLNIHMKNIYWFYIFFKDIFKGSILNLMAFIWALIGNIIANISSLIIKNESRYKWRSLIYLLESYIIAFKNLKNILMARLDFFNKNFKIIK
jgi:GT2 family glycosyltransferase